MQGRRINRFSQLAVLLLCLTAATPVRGETLPVRMRLEPLIVRGRSDGPVVVQIKLEYNRNQILEGDLLLKVYDSIQSESNLTATIRYDGIVLHGNDYFLSAILPPIPHATAGHHLVAGWFVTESETIPLPSDPKFLDPPAPHEILSVYASERSTVIGFYSGRGQYKQESTTERFLKDVLRLDAYNPPARGVATNQLDRIQTRVCDLGARDMHSDPLHLCCFDVIVLTGGALAKLEQQQLNGLATWVEAGGSLCVQTNNEHLTDRHLNFLQRLFEHPKTDPILALSDQNSLVLRCNSAAPIVFSTPGLGRALLLPCGTGLDKKLRQIQPGPLVAHLWKVRQYNGMQHGMKLPETDYAGQQTQLYSFDPHPVIVGLGPGQRHFLLSSESALLPDGIQIVPFGIIAMLMTAYVLTVGPVDYFVLGLLKVRKYTWFLFPIVTAAFTAVTLMIAHQSMQTTETGDTLSIVDIGRGNRPLRRTDVRMHFHSSNSTINQQNRSSFVASMRTGSAPGVSLSYSGRFPQHFESQIPVRQWEPVLTRSMTLAPESILKLPTIPWDDTALITSEAGHQNLQQLLADIPITEATTDVVILNGQAVYPIQTANALWDAESWRQVHRYLTNVGSVHRRQQYFTTQLLQAALINSAAADLVPESLSGYFGIVSQVSPHGAASLEDLPLLDTSDDNQWLLMVVITHQDQTTVFRRLYRTGDPVSVRSLNVMLSQKTADVIETPNKGGN